MPNEQWQQDLNSLKGQLETLRPQAGGGWEIPEPAREAFRKFAEASKDDVNRRVFVIGQLDVERMVAVVREGLCPWWPVFTARAYKADLDGMKKVRAAFEADAGKSEKPNMSSAMTWIVCPHKITDSFSNTVDPKISRQLFSWGADVNHDSGKWLESALRNLDADGIKPYLEFGAASGTILRVMDDLQKKQNFAQLGKIQDALAHSSFVKVDDQTLLEAKYIPDARNCSVFKTIFNFRSRRVHEIYEAGQGANAVMDGIPFADYDPEALAFAAEKLRQLGGKPRDPGQTIEKPAKHMFKGLQNG
jgi:hypothetical protein